MIFVVTLRRSPRARATTRSKPPSATSSGASRCATSPPRLEVIGRRLAPLRMRREAHPAILRSIEEGGGVAVLTPTLPLARDARSDA